MTQVTSDMARRRKVRYVALALTTLIATTVAQLVVAAVGFAGTLWIQSGGTWNGDCGVFQPIASSGSLWVLDQCGVSQGLALGELNSFGQGTRAAFQAYAPPGVTINSAWIPSMHVQNLIGGWGGGDYWAGGGNPWTNGMTAYSTESPLNPQHPTDINSPYWGFQLVCYASTCPDKGLQMIAYGVQLKATENTGPSLTAIGSNNLWYQRGRYVRGDGWPISFSSTDSSGVCDMSARVNGQPIPGPSASRSLAVWHQCPDQSWNQVIDTRTFVPASGNLSLELDATNAAGVSSSAPETLLVDNDPVGLTLSGPADAPSTAGTQYVNASAAAGPSGVSQISCSVDAGPTASYRSATASVPVSGVGPHAIRCTAYNAAIDPSGSPAGSPAKTWAMTIRDPTTSAIGFTRIAGLRCQRARVRVLIPARWVTVSRHGKRVRVRIARHVKATTVTKCHPRIVWRRVAVWVTVRRHGKRVRVKAGGESGSC